MHSQFHINWIGKQWIIDKLAVSCGLRKDVGTYVDGDRIERSKENRRTVILSLVAEGFMSREPGETQYTVLSKAFERIDPMPWTHGEFVVQPQMDGYGLRGIDVGLMKTILVDIHEGRVVLTAEPSGDVVLRLPEEAKTSDEQKAEQWVFENLPSIAAHVLELSEASAQLVSLRGQAVDRTLDELPLIVEEITNECCKEINRLRMREEALLALTIRVERAGGWDKFIAGCRTLQKLHALASTPGEGEAALRQAAEDYKDEQAGARGQS